MKLFLLARTFQIFLLFSGILLCFLISSAVAETSEQKQKQIQQQDENNNGIINVQERIVRAKMELWSRGAFSFAEQQLFHRNLQDIATALELQATLAPLRHGPVRKVRQDTFEMSSRNQLSAVWEQLRGGGTIEEEKQRLPTLAQQLGPEFEQAIEQNRKDHAEDCRKSCELFYCASPKDPLVPLETLLPNDETAIASYSMGAVPPEDFASEFGFPLDLIKVTQGVPLFSAEEAATVIANAEEEGVDKNEYISGKYKLGGKGANIL